MRNTKKRSSFMKYGKWVPILTLLLGFCLFTIWILFSSIDEEETENSKVEVARRLVAAIFQPIEEFVRRKEHKKRNLTISTTRTNTPQILDLRKHKMQIDLNGVWNLNRSEGFDEYLRETGVGWAKRKMATTLGQTLTITHQELHFEIMITFIGIYSKVLTFNVGDEMEIDVGPTVNTSVRSSIQEGKLVLEGVCDGKPYKNSRFVENGELVQVMQLGDTQCKRIFTRKS